MKKLLTILMLLAASLPLWAEEFQVDGISYYTTGEGTVAVTSGGSYGGAIVIPSTVTYNGTTFSVTSIGYNAFSYCYRLTSITIPNSVTSIGEQAFENCISLKKLDISENIESLGKNYLYGNQQDLTIVMHSLNPPMHVDPYVGFDKSGWTLEIPSEEVQPLYKEKGWIGEYKLSYFDFESDGVCYEAISNSQVRVISNVNKYSGAVIIPSTVEYDGTTYSVIEIDESAFEDCTGLTSITIPNSVTSIGSSAFSGCSGLTEITIPNSVTSIGNDAFSKCTGLTSITIPDGVTSIGNSTFSGCAGLTSVAIPNSVTSIGYNAFDDCTGLTSITIPNSVTSIGNYAFDNCTSLKEVKIEDGAETLSLGYNYYNNRWGSTGEGLFYDCPLESLYLGRNLSYGESRFDGYSPFYNINTLKEITISNSVTSIGKYAFAECTSLTRLDISENIESLGSDYLYGNQQDLTIVMRSLNPPMHVDPYHGFDKSEWKLIIPSEEVLPLYKEKGWIGEYEIIYMGEFESFKFEAGGICYKAISNSEVRVISNANKYSGAVIIPSMVEYDGTTYSVIEIVESAFKDCTELTSVTIPNSVTSIGDSTFSGCAGLTSITIPNSVTSIGNRAFFNCTGLTSITIPNSVTSIGEYAFSGCTGLTEITIPNSVTSIGEQAFSGCTGLTSITIPNSVTSIGNYAFSGCTGLTEVTIGNGISSIPSYCFYGCTGLTEITIPNSVTSIGEQAFSGCTFSNIYISDIATIFKSIWSNLPRASTFNLYLNEELLTHLVIPDGITAIQEDDFSGCTVLRSITIPNSVTLIGNSAFDNCTSLKEVKMEDGDATLSLGYNVYHDSRSGEGLFYDCPLESLYLGRNISYEEEDRYGYSPFYNIKTLKEITIGNSVTSIGNYAFSGCKGLTSITIGNRVTSIGGYAFSDCIGLTSITIPNSVTSIGNSVFDNCTSLKEVKIEEGDATLSLGYNACNYFRVGEGLFYDCPLESLYLGRNISYEEEDRYGYSPFYNIITLKEITIGNSVTSIGSSAFSGCTGLTEVTIGNSVTSIGWYAFAGCTGLTEVTIGNSVTSIGWYAFDGCTGLTSITIPNSVTSIGIAAFQSCKFSNIYFDDMAAICNGVWSDLPRASAVNLYLNNELLTELVIPDSITAIGNNAFQNCTGLTSITIPNSVTTIGNSVFDNCTSLKEVKMEDGDATLSLGYNYYNREETGQGLFNDCPLESLYLGRNLSYEEGYQYGYSPFCNNKTLKEITIGNSVASIGSYAFDGCTGLTSITIPNSVTSIGNSAFRGCTGLTSINLPNSVTSIGECAFYNCTGLTSITIPNSVTSIGEKAFDGCSNISVINAHPTTPPAINSDTFMDSVKQSAILNVPSLSAYTTADVWKDFADIREFAIEGYYDFDADGIYYRIVSLSDKTVEVVAKDDNYNNYSGDVVIPEIVFFKNNNFTVVAIGQAAFHNCNELLSLTIPQHVEEIKAGALSGCSALKTLTIADSDKTLKSNQNFKGLSIESLYLGRDYEGDFSACVSLQNVEISNKIIMLKEYTFDGCTSLTQLVLPESLKTIESYALSKTGIKELVIPAAVSEIKDNACSNSEISKLIIEAKDVIFSNNAFSNCPLTHIYLKETIKDGYKNLKTVVIGGDLDNSDNHSDTFINCNIDELIIDCEKVHCLFSNCNISKLHFSNNLTGWCVDGFDNRNDFIEISFGNDVTNIYHFITTGCSNLKTVKFGNKVESISANFGNSLEAMSVYSYNTTPPALEHAFANKTYMQGTLYVPKGCKDVYLAADGWKDFWNVEEISSITDNNLSYNLLEDNTLALIPDATGYIYSGQVVIPATVEVDGEVYKVSRIEANTFDNAYGVTSVIIEDSKEPLTIGEREEEITDNNYRVLLSDCMLDSVYVGRELAYQIKELETPEYVLYNNSPFTNNTYLSKVAVGPEVLTMGGAMFYGCRNIRNVYATGMIPPLEAEFETQVYEKATLTIPKGTLEAYTTTAGWEEFLNIVEEKVFSDIIENVNQPNTPIVVVSNGELTVMNGNAQDIAIYNMSGNLIYRGVNRPVRIDIHGVYIVVVDGFATKVVI